MQTAISQPLKTDQNNADYFITMTHDRAWDILDCEWKVISVRRMLDAR